MLLQPFCFLLAIATFLGAARVCSAQGVWKVRDVAAKSAFVTADVAGDVSSLHLKLDARSANDRDTCTVIDTTGNECAVTLAFCIPLDAIGGIWCNDPQTNRKIIATETKPYANLSDNAAGVTNEASLYPIAVVCDADHAKATVLACPPDVPRMVRFVYDPAAKELRAEFDFGLSRLPVKFPSRADAAVVRYEVPATWAFRRALQKYYELFPDAFVRRVKTGGIWMPFGETGGIKDAADFGFAFHEMGDSQVQPRILGDDARVGCASYIYVEPQSYWQVFHGKGPGTYDERLAQLEADAKAGDRVSQATLVSGVIRASGKRDLYLPGVPYTTQLPWGVDPNPLFTPDSRGYPSKGTYEFDRLEPLLGWRDKPNLGVAGIYVDSMEGWGEICNYNKEAWRAAQAPLTFDPANHNKISLLNFWGVYAWVREMSTRLHAHQMTLFGNDAYFRRWQLAPWVDVPGREYTWTDNAGKLAPIDESHLLFLRSMSARRPYLMLMNNRYEDGSIMEPYFQRAMFFGVFPSMFSGQQSASDVAYFSNPVWYNRDRALFKKYIPMIRKLDAAGWEPVPLATTDPASARIERYGSFEHDDLAFTVHNTSDHEQDVTLKLSRGDLHLPDRVAATTWIHPESLAPATDSGDIKVTLHLPADGYEVIGIAQPR